LTFSVKSSEVDLTEDDYNKIAFFTDGRKLRKSKDASYREITAHWKGNQLMTDEKTPQGAKMSRTFELSPDGRQFFETIHVDRGRSIGLLTVRYVYDVSSGYESELNHQTDPNQPVMKRRSDNSGSDTSSQGTQASQQDGLSSQPRDPDQPVMKRRDGGE
jgi:hypothetical protein